MNPNHLNIRFLEDFFAQIMSSEPFKYDCFTHAKWIYRLLSLKNQNQNRKKKSKKKSRKKDFKKKSQKKISKKNPKKSTFFSILSPKNQKFRFQKNHIFSSKKWYFFQKISSWNIWVILRNWINRWRWIYFKHG